MTRDDVPFLVVRHFRLRFLLQRFSRIFIVNIIFHNYRIIHIFFLTAAHLPCYLITGKWENVVNRGNKC